ncbi:hypothetical protein [Rubinisphaera sp.]|uniref:hypothetical protein n=1 Tax=Rubinisphaera sp. TaxID=2024857 RepID=UPI000C0CE847|nr:hypothetical protein [Rubinisphaera sp.]MBV09598.1 hypothetical protein [Rubinisphaera sp.]HCS50091.1 hypothetical protein [Planctomycetaceae bacterium]|tara:strand:+ start:384 stop:596 length:213 start_codon:yes stop_codon:yes gene_type:complete
MTELLEQLFDRVSKLPPEEQDEIANWIMKELDSERKWDDLFAKSQNQLSEMGAAALAENRNGLTEEMKFE